MRTTSIVVSAVLIVTFASAAPTPGRAPCADDERTARAELIVVGRLKPLSIKPGTRRTETHTRRPDKFGLVVIKTVSTDHHATLIITEVLKGTVRDREIPVILDHGLTPMVGGVYEAEGQRIDLRGPREDYPKDRVEILDTCGGFASRVVVVKDVHRDNLWFLRQRVGEVPAADGLAVTEAEDIQALSLKDYFLAHLSADPEAALKALVAKRPELAGRVRRALDRLEFRRILELPDAKRRVRKLLPYFTRRKGGDDPEMQLSAKRGIVGCGEAAGFVLMKLFDQSADPVVRRLIVEIWGETRY